MAISKVSPTIYVYKATLGYVKDGDTIDAEIDMGFKFRWQAAIRFYGVDTYESMGANVHPLGAVAKQFLIKLFEQYGPTFYLHSIRDEIGAYNRVTGKIYLETTVPGPDPKKPLRAFIDVIQTMRDNGFDKSGEVPYVEGRAPIVKPIVASDIDVIVRP